MLNMTASISKCKEHCKDLQILYVEDNPKARMFTMEMLKRFFENITIACNGKEGLNFFESKNFDLVLTDINMPEMSGLEMAKEIKKIKNTTPILILSAHNEADYFISSIKIGIDGYLLKPLDVEQFIETIAKTVEKIYLQKEIEDYQEKLKSSNENLEIKIKERTAELEYRLYHDKLTELRNHQSMMNIIGSSPYETIFLLDINGFQKFNDIYGLNAGNTILKELANLLKKFNANKLYSLHRIYGDVFVLYHGSDNPFGEKFTIQKQKLLNYLNSFKVYLEEIDEDIYVDITTGVSVDETNPFIKAEMALSHAKKRNENIFVYKPEIDSSKQLLNDIYWKTEIKTALESDRILPVFQGIVDITSKIVKYECLMRLSQFEQGEEKLISPFLFLDSAIKTQQYKKLTKTMVKKSFEQMQNSSIDFSINLSYEDLSDPVQVEFLHTEIVNYGVGKRVIFEVLESETVSDYAHIINVLKNFRTKGVRVAIDDFGSGYSNFEHILKLKPDYIKIDSSLIKNILHDEHSFTLVKAISEFSRELGIKVIAEFVSSKEIFEALKSLSIDEYQGFYFSVPSKEFS